MPCVYDASLFAAATHLLGYFLRAAQTPIIPNTQLLPCQDDVLYRVDGGLAVFNFRTNSQMFMLIGTGDRQPNPSNLYQNINDAWIIVNKRGPV
jgi:hypothetical protein